MTVDKVRQLFRQAADYKRVLSTQKVIEDNATNNANADLVLNLQELVDQIGIDYPLQAEVLRLRYFKLHPQFKIGQILNYSERLIKYKEKEGLELIARELSKLNYDSPAERLGLGL